MAVGRPRPDGELTHEAKEEYCNDLAIFAALVRPILCGTLFTPAVQFDCVAGD